MNLSPWLIISFGSALLLTGLIFRVFRSRKASREGRLQLMYWGPVVHPMKTWDWGSALVLVGLMVLRSELNDLQWLAWHEGWQYLCMAFTFGLLLFSMHRLGLWWGTQEKPTTEKTLPPVGQN